MLTWVILTLFMGLLFWVTRKPSYLPPGRWGLPVIGYLPILTKNFTELLNNMRSKYGDVFTWRIGSRVMVCLCDYKMIKNIFAMPECQGRADFFSLDAFKYGTNSGLVSSVGEAWSEGRRFALRHLKDFGMGKTCMDEVIQYEAVALAKCYDATAGTPVELSWNLNVAVLNVIWKIVANHRYETDDEDVIKFNKIVAENFDMIQGSCSILDMIPGLHKILPEFILNKYMRVDNLLYNAQQFKELFREVILKHKKERDPNNPKDFIDVYLNEMEENDNGKKKKNPIFDNDSNDEYINLIASITDLFAAGSETTSSTMRWVVCLLASHPEVQEKVQKEIDVVISRDKTPSLQDREKLPYTEAVLFEAQRYASFLPISLFHTNTEDIRIGDYYIPKGTLLFPNSEGCHRDPKYWEKPDEFYPEHFLDDEGQLLMKTEGYLPFSIGRRQCLGMSLAKMELFLFTTCLFQRFSIAPPEGVTLKADTDRSTPIFNFVKPYKVVMTKRP